MIRRLIVPARASRVGPQEPGFREFQVVELVSGTPVPAMIDQKTYGQTSDLYFDFKPPAVTDFASFFVSLLDTMNWFFTGT
jgi:hypothetical protein